jgi:hypothetical protein
VAVLGDLDLDSSSRPADAMQNFCDSRISSNRAFTNRKLSAS